MARVAALISDLMFASRIQAPLQAAGHELLLCSTPEQLEERLDGTELVIVDLTDEVGARIGLVEGLNHSGALRGVPTLAVYAHVEAEVRERALGAGFTAVVPRSRMAREGDRLVARLLAESSA
jgi:CheY-like chemotaxis protein